MITYYCPHCWTEISEQDEICPECGYVLVDFQRLPYTEKLIRAVRHSVPERQVMAIQILGELNSAQALPEFRRLILDQTTDFYVLREVIAALTKIIDPESEELLQLAARHSSVLVSNLAKEKLEIKNGEYR